MFLWRFKTPTATSTPAEPATSTPAETAAVLGDTFVTYSTLYDTIEKLPLDKLEELIKLATASQDSAQPINEAALFALVENNPQADFLRAVLHITNNVLGRKQNVREQTISQRNLEEKKKRDAAAKAAEAQRIYAAITSDEFRSLRSRAATLTRKIVEQEETTICLEFDIKLIANVTCEARYNGEDYAFNESSDELTDFMSLDVNFELGAHHMPTCIAEAVCAQLREIQTDDFQDLFVEAPSFAEPFEALFEEGRALCKDVVEYMTETNINDEDVYQFFEDPACEPTPPAGPEEEVEQ